MQVLVTRELAEMAGMNRKTIERLAREKKIPGAFKTPSGFWRFDADQARLWVKKRQTSTFYEEAVDGLYDLDRSELRSLAYEALLISDGPDRIEGSISRTAVIVNRQQDGTFKVFKEDT